MALTQRFIVVAVLLVSTHTSFAQELWRGTRDGMSPDEVTKLLPDTHAADASEGYTRLTIDKVPVGNRSFVAWFYFKEGKLTQVVLDELKRGYRTEVDDDVRDFLRLKYGPEVSSRTSSHGFYAIWRDGKTTIELSIDSVKNTMEMTTVTYGTRLIGEAAKL